MSAILLKIDQDAESGDVLYSFTIKKNVLVRSNPPTDMVCEFNPKGGISSDLVKGGWEGETVVLPEESLPALLMRLAYMAASIDAETSTGRSR